MIEREIIFGGEAMLRVIQQMMLRGEITAEQYAASEIRLRDMKPEEKKSIVCIY